MPEPSLNDVLRRLGLAAALVGSVAVPTAGQEVTYTGSLQIASGDYIFTERTTSFYVVNGLELATGPVRVAATVPVIRQSTPWVTYGSVPIPSGAAEGAEVARQLGQMGQGARMGGRTIITLPTEGVTSQSGFGDPLVRADVEVLADAASRPSLRVHAATKLPVADPADGFGTGEWDYGAGLSLSKRAGPHAVFADVAYWRFGDLADLELKDAMAYGLAYGRTIGTGRWSVLASVSGWTSILSGADPPVEVGIGLSRLWPGTRRGISVMAGVGLTETAPDVSISLGWRIPMTPVR